MDHRLFSVACTYGTGGWRTRGPGFEITKHLYFSPPSVFHSFFSSFTEKNTYRVWVKMMIDEAYTHNGLLVWFTYFAISMNSLWF